MPAIHQFVAGFSKGDAISNEALVLQRVFRSWEYDSDIFCEAKRILPELRRLARDVGDYPTTCAPDDVVILHLSIGSPVNALFAALKCRKCILYHNVTPAHYFTLVNNQTARHLADGREQVRALAGAAEVNLADSAFNAGELLEMGYRDVHVLPLVLDLDQIHTQPDRGILKRFRDHNRNILFVGRCAPNKRIDDLLTAFYYYQKHVDPESRFIHVGSAAGTESYAYLQMTRARELGLRNVHFAGSVIQTHLSAYYSCAHLFLSMSEHEGFGIPLLESMAHDIPVLAYAATAVPETLDGAGVLFREKSFEAIAEMMGKLCHDPALRAGVLRGQRDRLARYQSRDLAAELKEHLHPLLPR